MLLVNPFDETKREQGRPAPRLDTLRGKTIALLDISKPGGSVFLDRIEKLLVEKHGVARVIRESKPTYTKPAPPEVLDRIRRAQVHAAIEALAD